MKVGKRMSSVLPKPACKDAGNAGDTVNRLISEYAEKLQLKENQ